MNRLLTTIVQLGLVISAVYMFRLMWADLKADVLDTIKDIRKQSACRFDNCQIGPLFWGRYPQAYEQVWKTPGF